MRNNNRAMLVVDCHNIFAEGSKLYPGKIVNYTNLVAGYKTIGLDVMQKVAFNKQPEGALISFATLLRRLGFTLHFGQPNYAVPMALRVADAICNKTVETLILGTNCPDAVHLLQFARDYGVRTYTFGFSMPKIFEPLSEVLELNENDMQDKKKKPNAKANAPSVDAKATQPVELCATVVSQPVEAVS